MVVMDYFPENLLQSIQKKCFLQSFKHKLYSYQMLRGMNYIHQLSICHRDIKPHNILVNQE